MKPFVVLATCLSLGCALGPGHLPPAPTSIWVRSHNQGSVDVYLLCGDHDARWLGTVSEKGSDAFEIPAGQTSCVEGLNFFLVDHYVGRGYWVGPLRPQRSQVIQLVIEKYAGLSSARLVDER